MAVFRYLYDCNRIFHGSQERIESVTMQRYALLTLFTTISLSEKEAQGTLRNLRFDKILFCQNLSSPAFVLPSEPCLKETMTLLASGSKSIHLATRYVWQRAALLASWAKTRDICLFLFPASLNFQTCDSLERLEFHILLRLLFGWYLKSTILKYICNFSITSIHLGRNLHNDRPSSPPNHSICSQSSVVTFMSSSKHQKSHYWATYRSLRMSQESWNQVL